MSRTYQSDNDGISNSTLNLSTGETSEEASQRDQESEEAEEENTYERRWLAQPVPARRTRKPTRPREKRPEDFSRLEEEDPQSRPHPFRKQSGEAEEEDPYERRCSAQPVSARRRRKVLSYHEESFDRISDLEEDDNPQLSTHALKKKPNLVHLERRERRRVDELGPFPVADPDSPTHNNTLRLRSDIYRQTLQASAFPPQGIPGSRTQGSLPSPGPSRVANMQRISGYPMSNGPSNNIVEEYLSPIHDAYTGDFQDFRRLTDSEKQDVIAREAEDYGLEKPQGWNVSFHYNPHVEYHHFGSSHPMKPWRLTLTKQLVLSYGLEYTMDLYEPRPATFKELAIFHDREYLSYLSEITPQNARPDDAQYIAYGFGGDSNDCPVFDGLWNYVSLYTGASMSAAWNLLNNQSDIAINWSGGLHHAKKNLASGFCYVNDIVIAIQLLLTQNQRVLYIDIDVHHGDGVEQAFESTDRVFTLSFHKYGIDRHGWPFFPGTGNIDETGPKDPANRGKAHSLNIPIDDGIDDEQYKWLFKSITTEVVAKYRPEAIVLQSGADSLGGDRLGRFNLNIKAHGFCIETVKSFKCPLVLIGGGGYTPRNVARTWCHETAVCVGAELHNDLPTHIPYLQAFQGEENGGGILYPDLHNTKRHDNLNTDKRLQKLFEQAMENLRYLEGAPSVVVNTRGISEEKLMKVREQVERELADEEEDRQYSLALEKTRRTRERNIGGRNERR